MPQPSVSMPGPAAAAAQASPTARQWTDATYAILLAGGRGSRLKQLTQHRAKPAMPFGGKLRLIDFTLSNCINSGVCRVSVLTQFNAQSLIHHISGAWGFLDTARGNFVDVVPAQQQIDEGWYVGTANAVYQNLEMLQAAEPKLVLVVAGDHVYKMDYGRIIADHVRWSADLTLACVEVPLAQASAFGVLQVDGERRVRAFAEKPASPVPLPERPGHALVNMGVYVFDAAFLYEELCRDAADPRSRHDFGGDLLPRLVAQARVFAHDFRDSCVNMVGDRPYWRDVGTIDAYWEANMDLTRPLPELNLYDEAWPMRSQHDHLPPAKFVFDDDGRRGTAVDSLISGGCIVSGATVRRSLLFAQVRVDDGSLVEDSLLLPGVRVGHGVVLRRAIIDSNCVLADGMRIGLDAAADRSRFTVTESGLTLVTPEMLGQGHALDVHRFYRHPGVPPAGT